MSTITIAGNDYSASKISELTLKETPSATDQIEIETVGGASMRINVSSLSYGAVTIIREAATALGGHRVVRLNANDQALYADCTTVTDASAVIGMTTGAADQGDNAIIQIEGELIEPTWDWNIDLPIFLSTQGQLTQNTPLSGFVLCVAVPIATDRIIVRIGEPILL